MEQFDREPLGLSDGRHDTECAGPETIVNAGSRRTVPTNRLSCVGNRADELSARLYAPRDRYTLPRVAYPLAGTDRNWPRCATPGPIA
jgi:hypothetical protein